MKSILLVSPGSPSSQQYSGIEKLSFLKLKSLMVPLQIATISAMTPDDIEVDLWDEPVQGLIDEEMDLKDYDLVGITGYSSQTQRIRTLGQLFRKREIPVALGGVAASVTPEDFSNLFDILFVGEAELTWPQFIADWKSGNYKKEYRQITKPDFSLTPPPRWNSIADQMHSYLVGAVQTMRGCPFDCEFCDAIYLYGRQVRCKPLDKVLEEITALQRLGIEHIFLCDDNLISNPRYLKELLKQLILLNKSFKSSVGFSGQISINVAHDEDLLELMADANFGTLFIGVETPNKESLKETNKYQNLRGNILQDCQKIQSYGMPIKAGMVVGFDHDGIDIFNRQFEFLQEANIPLPSPYMLMAMRGTKLWLRLLKEGRVIKDDKKNHNSYQITTNVIPKRMTRVELLSGYASLVERLYSWDNSVKRIKGFISGIKRWPHVPAKKRKLKLKRLLQLINFLLSVDKETRRAVIDVVFYTRKNAPSMMERILALVLQQYGFTYLVKLLREKLYEQIEVEKNSDIESLIDRSVALIPKCFEKIYREIFSEIYEHVNTGLNDKTSTDQALVEVFVNFLARWGKTLEQFSDQHKVYIYEHADRVIDKENGTTVTSSPILPQSTGALSGIEQSELAGEILKTVEQELRG